MKSSEDMILAVMNAVFKPEKFRTSTGFEPVTSRYQHHRHREVAGSNPVKVLNFSGFSTHAVVKTAFMTARIIASFDL